MSHLENLRQSRSKSIVAYQEFMNATRQYATYLFCFFEGKDNDYYKPRIKNFTDKYHAIRCGGREQVLEVHRLIAGKKEYERYKKGFFIDKDFNEPLPPQTPPIFETPCYSIENLYVSIDVFKNILEHHLGISSISKKEIFEKCVQIYTERQQEFHNLMLPFNAWYACLIDIRNKTGSSTNVKLEDKLLKEIMEITLMTINAQKDLMSLQAKFPNAPNVPSDELELKIATFKKCNATYIFRGKYELLFLIELIRLLIKDSLTAKNIFKEKIKFTFGDASQIGIEQALAIFSNDAETPDSLKRYLKTIT